MFVGHFAVALAGKRAAPELSLAWYIAAATLLDLLWPLFLLAGIEHVAIKPGVTAFTPLVLYDYPWSHSLLMAVVWGIALALLARLWKGVGFKTALLLVALVVSHWVLDFITHAPDMPLWPGDSPLLGLGLWNSIPGTFIVEGLLWLAGLVLYLQPRQRRSWVGPLAFWSLAGISTVMWAAGPWSVPPPNPQALAWFALIGWIILPWAAWADRYYRLRNSA